MRISEVLAMRVADIDRERPLIWVRCGKGGDGRLVRCEPTLRDRLRDYWALILPRRQPGASGASVSHADHRSFQSRRSSRLGD
jgi:integrase